METRLHSKGKAAANTSFTAMHSRIVERKCACGGSWGSSAECKECAKRNVSLQRSTRNAAPPTRDARGVPPIVHEVLRSPGQPLDAASRAFFEPRFGHDFSQVRLHTDAKAAESARAVTALAYTVGRDVVFGSEQFAPRTTEEQLLLAHELTHVVQQSNALETQAAGSISALQGTTAEKFEDEAKANSPLVGTNA